MGIVDKGERRGKRTKGKDGESGRWGGIRGEKTKIGRWRVQMKGRNRRRGRRGNEGREDEDGKEWESGRGAEKGRANEGGRSGEWVRERDGESGRKEGREARTKRGN